MNGYFQLIINESGSGLKVFHPTDKGQPISVNEVIAYLSDRAYSIDPPTLQRAIASAQTGAVIPLTKEQKFPERETFEFLVAPDKMTVSVRFYPPSNNGAQLTEADIISDLGMKQIVYGIDKDAIVAFLKERVYCTDIVLVKGKPPVHGIDAKIEYFFNTDLRIRPTLNDDGSVDFFNLNTLNHCKKGDVLAVLHKETKGEPGANVYGELISPREVRRDILKFGKNISLSEDELSITTDVSGHVSLVENKVFVSDIYQIENVDNATGNIEYEGSVMVNGNVCANFTVKASGNVQVKGVVEGAVIEAGGDIIIERGMNGMGKGILNAKGNIITKFVENATLTAGGSVETNSILHSRVSAKTEINVLSKKGFIAGGRVTATNAINVKNLGTEMGADTLAEVGLDPEAKRRINQLGTEITENRKSVDSMIPILQNTKAKLVKGVKLTADQIEYFKKLTVTLQEKQNALESDVKELEQLQEALDTDSDSVIVVSGKVYAGTRIMISDVSMVIRETMNNCKFVKNRGDVKRVSL